MAAGPARGREPLRKRSKSRRRRLRLTRTVSLALLLALAGLFIAVRPASQPGRDRPLAAKDLTAGGRAVTNADKRVTSATDDLFTIPSVAQYLAGHADGLTAALYDKASGYTSLYRPGVAEDTASIMKVDILATLLSQAQTQDRSLTPDEQDLSQDMIEESDDDDAQDLWNAEGGAAAVRSFDADAGLTRTDPDEAGYWGLSTTTAADQVELLKKVAYPNTLLTDASRDYELDLMTHVDPDQAWGVSSGVPPNASIALKNGWLPLDSGGWQINSIGSVDGDGRNYLVAVLTNGNSSEAQGIDTIDGLSRLIWKELAPASRT